MKSKLGWLLITISSIVFTAIGLITTGCKTTTPRTEAGPATADKSPAGKDPAAKQGGAQLWALNCGHCHNIRSPNSYSDAQWDVVMLHMRVRANLTADEHTKILAFLKSAH
ncbi:MAG: hypothetical protein HY298_13110 [Verrucomicrobia bacterium]|nr:hypothetical protein [Verrucomicrobiota bacterium]